MLIHSAVVMLFLRRFDGWLDRRSTMAGGRPSRDQRSGEVGDRIGLAAIPAPGAVAAWWGTLQRGARAMTKDGTRSGESLHTLPKAEVHVHLEGCFEPATLESWARQAGVPMP